MCIRRLRKYVFLLQLCLVVTAADAIAQRGDCALVAGGSRGIGYAIAEALAKRGWDLVLVARHLPDLDSAKAKLERSYKVHVDVFPKDMSLDSAAAEIAAFCTEKKLRIRMLCNVAGFGGARDFLQLPADTIRYMTRLNFESFVMLTQAMLPQLERNAPAYILNVASMAGFGPMPAKNIYSATKSAVVFFSYNLRYQLRARNISVSCLAPGPVYTKPEVVNTTRRMLGNAIGDWIEVPPARVGELAVRRTLKGRMMIVPGTVANLSSNVIRAFPRRWMAAIYGAGGNR